MTRNQKIILYDLTNTYFEGSKRNSAIAKRGKSKEKRDDCPLLSLAMAIDSEGFPKRSKIYEGNISEASTLETVLSQISFGDINKRKTIVMDSGIATEENIQKIKPHYDYIAVSRKRPIPYEKWESIDEEKILLRDKKTTLTMKSLEVGDEVYLLCHSEAKEKKERGIIKRRQSKFETELKSLAEGLYQPRKMKNYEKVLEKIGRLKEKYKVGQHYDIKVRRNKNKATSITFSKNSKGQLKSEHVGEYLLRTNRKDLSNREISQVHRSLTMIEASFRSMKSDLGLRPIYHQNDKRSEAHLYISVIAYHFVAAILKQLQGNGINLTWNSVRNVLASRKRVTTTFNTEKGEIISIRTNTAPNLEQAEIYQSFKRLKPAVCDAKHMIKLK
ncbi:MAG: IS1634 family transposase [Bacteroidota bacterium]|nr:IS1634 family transposase [Bacteroidota bacterium]